MNLKQLLRFYLFLETGKDPRAPGQENISNIPISFIPDVKFNFEHSL
jgi:hypothetical protein